jgi:hypothetical protein
MSDQPVRTGVNTIADDKRWAVSCLANVTRVAVRAIAGIHRERRSAYLHREDGSLHGSTFGHVTAENSKQSETEHGSEPSTRRLAIVCDTDALLRPIHETNTYCA